MALQLCWAVGEHGGGGASHKDAARELFEGLELLLYENLSSRCEFCFIFKFCFFLCDNGVSSLELSYFFSFACVVG